MLAFIKNWKTTLIGAAGALLIVVGGEMQDGAISWAELASAASTALLGFFAKDFNKTGA